MSQSISSFGSQRRLLVVGWDGADWDVINPLIDRGLMPHLESIINRGVMGQLATVQPQCLPLLWTSIATGNRADQHQVLGYVRPRGDSIEPCQIGQRHSPAFWDVLSDHDWNCHVIGWPTFPAETTSGIFVSNLFSKTTLGFESCADLSNKRLVSPVRVLETLWDQRISPADISIEQLSYFVPAVERVDQESQPSLAILATALAEAFNTQAAATWALENEVWDMATVCFDLIDRISHVFMAFSAPQLQRVSDRDFHLYQNVVAASYQFADMMLGRLLELAGNDTGVIVFSDHGFRSGDRRLLLESPNRAQTSLHRPLGILAMRGQDIPADQWIWNASLLDIAPTILSYFGVPHDPEMEGRSLIVVNSSSPANLPQVNSQQTNSKPKYSNFAVADCELTDSEASLGLKNLFNDSFIEAVHLNVDPANRAHDACQFNLAQSCLETNGYESATKILRQLVNRRPDVARYKIQLATCLLALQEYDECRQLLDQAFAQDVPEFFVERVRGQVELSVGNCEQAIVHFFNAQQSHPDYPGIDALIGMAYVRMNKLEQAKFAFVKALQKNPDDEQSLFEMGNINTKEDKLQDAIDCFLQAVSIRNRFPEAHFELGMAFAKTGQVVKAKSAFTRCLALKPDWPDVVKELAKL